MSLTFKEEGHKYESIDPEDQVEWLSVTSFVAQFKQPFDPDQAYKSVKNKKSPWYDMDPEHVKAIWKGESDRATGLGTYYHNQRETDLTECKTLTREGIEIPVVIPVVEDGVKYAPPQRLTDGVYPEHFAYLRSAEICGQADYIEVVNGVVNIIDYKTNKEIKTKGHKNWKGEVSKMNSPVSHLDDCHINHYNLQLSLYMYMILKHNPRLKAGKLIVHHVIFEKIRNDKYGYPVTLYNDNGDPVVKEVVPYEMDYMKEEVISMINWLHDNRDNLKAKS